MDVCMYYIRLVRRVYTCVLYELYLRVCSVFLAQNYKRIHVILYFPEIGQIKHLQYQCHVINLFIWMYMYDNTKAYCS